jgi:hemoglobin/transferrin/lactoferrin receptor protein
MDAGLENIFDKRYRGYSSGISAPGRNFIGTIRIKF